MARKKGTVKKSPEPKKAEEFLKEFEALPVCLLTEEESEALLVIPNLKELVERLTHFYPRSLWNPRPC